MTYKEKLIQDHPDYAITGIENMIADSCPRTYGYGEKHVSNCNTYLSPENCVKCWDQEMPAVEPVSPSKCIIEGLKEGIEEERKRIKDYPPYLDYPLYSYTEKKKMEDAIDKVLSSEPTIKDSGDRTEFASGAVRDMHEGKGRCDLLPLDVIWEYIKLRKSNVEAGPIGCIMDFISSGDIDSLHAALSFFTNMHYDGEDYTMFLEVAKHFEEGAKKYGDNNWRKGIPVRCYIDSAVRHYLKYLRGDKDEPHDRAFCWNILCCIWTCKHKPELNDYAKKDGE